ncbi:MAG: AI-2E family transporter [Gammaproteobacteria bacterium]|jgi:predicted PurR-regulated permease PerM
MNSAPHPATDQGFLERAVEAAIRIGLVAVLAAWCFSIFRPFLNPVLWGIIIAVAIHPLFRRLLGLFGGRRGRAAIVLTLLVLALLIVPTIMLGVSLIDTAQRLADGIGAGTVKVPPPPDAVAGWPLVGERLHAFWRLASENLVAAIEQTAPQLKALGGWLLSALGGLGVGVLQFIVAIIIAGILLANDEGGKATVRRIATRLAGEQGAEFADIAGATVRSVAQGVLGVALIQAMLAGIGMLVVDVPGAGLWALLVLLLAIVQLPPILVLGPVIVYVFSVESTLPAVVFTIWSLIVGASDSFLKPLLLGRGVNIPMLVILIGAIGGMILSGVIGLFVGAVVLAVGYKLFIAWLYRDIAAVAEVEQSPPTGPDR